MKPEKPNYNPPKSALNIESQLPTNEKLFNMLLPEDLFQKAFLKPVQISLKNPPSQKQIGKSSGSGPKNASLPNGLNIINKKNISQNKILKKDQQFGTTNKRNKYEEITVNNQDNLLSLLKTVTQFQLAICICMYSEDKRMLKNTLAGISQNMDYFVRGGLSTDKIGIFVIMDGIEKVDQSVVEYCDELERQSFIMLNEDLQPHSIKQLLQKDEQFEYYEEDLPNINTLIFTPQELQQRRRRRFKNRYEQYKYIRTLQKRILVQMKDKTLIYDELDIKTQQFFLQIIKQRYKEEFGIQENQQLQQLNSKPSSFFLQPYVNDLSKSRPIIMQSLSRTKRHCEQYISSRDSLAFLSFFRVPVTTRLTKDKQQEKQENSKNELKIGSPTKTEKQRLTVKMEDSDEELQNQKESIIKVKTQKMNIFICAKYKNLGKISSHNWFFNGFCKELNPQYAVLLDVGLRPERKALYKMYQYMKVNENTGGVCGYMGLKIEPNQTPEGYNPDFNEKDVDFITRVTLKFVDIQRAQQMQYHLAHFIDKPFEAMFNFIHVLPGAFSAYNLKSFQKKQDNRQNNENKQDKTSVLQKYFKSILQKQKNLKIKRDDENKFSAFKVVSKLILPDFIYYKIWPLKENSEEDMLYDQNVYLAEDRILSMGIHENSFDIAYLPDAYAWVDPITNLHMLLGQRKRWINGSFFAFEKVKKIQQKSSRSQPLIYFQFMLLTLMNVMAYVSPALYLYSISVALQVIKFDGFGPAKSSLPLVVVEGFEHFINFGFVLILAATLFYSMFLTNKNQRFKPVIYGASTMMGIISLIVFIILLVDVFKNSSTFLVQQQQYAKVFPFDIKLLQSLRYIVIATIVLYSLPILLYMILFRRFSFLIDVAFCTFSFIYYSPTYLNLLNIYALSRVNDISWGTKGLDTATSSAYQQTWNLIRMLHVGKYLFWNSIVYMLLGQLGRQSTSRFIVTYIIIILLSVTLLIKIVIGLAYMIYYKCCKRIPDPPYPKQLEEKSKIDDIFTKTVKPLLEREVKNNIDELCKQSFNQNKNSRNNGLSQIHRGFQMSQIMKKSQAPPKSRMLKQGANFIQGQHKPLANKDKYRRKQQDTKALKSPIKDK